MSTTRRRFAMNLLLIAVSTLASIGLAEVVLRQIYVTDTGTSYQHRIPHPTLGWVLEPSASYTNRLPESDVPVTYNSLGFRDVERSHAKQEQTYRIVVLGDSYMEGYSVTLEESFHRQLESLAKAAGRKLEVINLGVGGYGTLQEYLLFREVGAAFQPDLVVLAFHLGNDLTNNILELESAFGTDSIKAKTRPFLSPDDHNGWSITQTDFKAAHQRYLKAKARNQGIVGKIAARSALVQLARNASKRFTAATQGGVISTEAAADSGVNRDAEFAALHGVHYCTEPVEYTRAWFTTKRIMSRLKAEVEATHGRLVVVTVPAISEVSERHMASVTERAPQPEHLCLQTAPGYERLATVLADLGIDKIDLLHDFRQSMKVDGTKLFRESDLHWNPEGHALAARVAFSALTDRNYLPKD